MYSLEEYKFRNFISYYLPTALHNKSEKKLNTAIYLKQEIESASLILTKFYLTLIMKYSNTEF